MNNEPFFNGGEIVKLKRDSEYNNLKVGDYGIVWAVYSFYIDESNTVLGFDYEGTFWNKEGDNHDEMFDEKDVEKVLKIEEAPYSREMKRLLRILTKQ